MSAQLKSRVIDYHNFTLCPDSPIKVRRRDDPSMVASFRFPDDKWELLDILRPHERDYEATVSFSEVAPWMREDAKLYVAHLWLRTEPEANLIQQVMVSLRDLGRFLSDFRGRSIDLRAQEARAFSRRYGRQDLKPVNFQRVRRHLNRFVAFVRQQHPEVTGNDFEVQFPKEKTFTPQHQPLEQAQEARIDGEAFAQIIDACAADTQAYYDSLADYVDSIGNAKEYKRKYDSECYYKKKQGLPHRRGKGPGHRELLSRAIKAQATILEACVGRRPSAVCKTMEDVKTEAVEWTDETGRTEKGVSVRFRESKVRNVDEDVFCPGIYGELALQAIETAKDLTAELRRHNPQWKDYLFLVPGRKRNSAHVLSTRQLNLYLNGAQDRDHGLIKRYSISGGKVSPLNFRHTRATNMWVGGLQVHEVAYDLGHASAEMAVRHYIVGNEESRKRLQFLMDHGALSGLLEDFVGGREMVEARLGRRHVEIMKRQGRIVSPTRYGYCCLPAASGPCIRTTPCYVGPGASGGGCDYHVQSPDALPVLYEDQEVIEVNIKTYRDDPDFREWVNNQRNQLAVVEDKIEQALALREKIECCEGKEPCGCQRGRRGKAPGGRN
jgi:integrase